MSRWIDEDKLNLFEEDGKVHRYCFPCIEIIRLIDEAPSIDIVKCGECKYEPICNHSVQHTTHDAHSITIGYKSVDYCSYGERKDI